VFQSAGRVIRIYAASDCLHDGHSGEDHSATGLQNGLLTTESQANGASSLGKIPRHLWP
jgi:hypothetical protein